MIMFDLLGCSARAAYYGVSAKVDDLKFKASYGLSNLSDKTKEKKKINLKPNTVEKEVEKPNIPKATKPEKKKEETVKPATVIENPTVEKEIVIVTEKPIDMENIHENAEQISSAIEKVVNECADEIIEAVSTMTESGIEKFVEKGLVENQRKFGIIVDAFIKKSEDEKAMAIYEAIIKNGDRILRSFETDSEQNIALYETFVQNVLGLKLDEVGYDGLDSILEKYEGFKELFQISTQRALDYLKTKETDETKPNSTVDTNADSKVKLNLEDKVSEEEKVGLNMPIKFVEDHTETPMDTTEEPKKEEPKTKNSRKSTSTRKR